MTDAEFVRHLAGRGILQGKDADRLYAIAKRLDGVEGLAKKVEDFSRGLWTKEMVAALIRSHIRGEG